MNEEQRKAIEELLKRDDVSEEYKAQLKALPGYEKPKEDGNTLAQTILKLFGHSKKKEDTNQKKTKEEEGEDGNTDGNTNKTDEERDKLLKKVKDLESYVKETKEKELKNQIISEASKVLKSEGYNPEKVLSIIDINKFLKVEDNIIKGMGDLVKAVGESGFAKNNSDDPNSLFREITLTSDYKKPEGQDDKVNPEKEFVDSFIAGKI